MTFVYLSDGKPFTYIHTDIYIYIEINIGIATTQQKKPLMLRATRLVGSHITPIVTYKAQIIAGNYDFDVPNVRDLGLGGVFAWDIMPYDSYAVV